MIDLIQGLISKSEYKDEITQEIGDMIQID
jgi:hypothetical protein